MEKMVGKNVEKKIEEDYKIFRKPNHDTTYCNSEICNERCWRHIENYDFDDENYWMMNSCEKIK